MKRKPILLFSALVTAALVAAAGPADAKNTSGVAMPKTPKFNKRNPNVYGKQIAEHVDRVDSGWVDSYFKAKIININARGEKSSSDTAQMLLEGDDGNKSLIRYMSPASVRGVGALTHENHGGTDDSWLYLPSSRRVRRISGANRTASFQGTEFTYEDLSTVVPSRYKWKYLSETTLRGQPVFKLQAIPTFKHSGYSKMHVFVHRKEWRVEGVDYFDKGGRLLKTLTPTGWKHHHGRFWRPSKIEMHNKQTQKRSVFDITAQFVNIASYKKKDGSAREGLKDSAFTRRALQIQ